VTSSCRLSLSFFSPFPSLTAPSSLACSQVSQSVHIPSSKVFVSSHPLLISWGSPFFLPSLSTSLFLPSAFISLGQDPTLCFGS
jgi:hypothetical protein